MKWGDAEHTVIIMPDGRNIPVDPENRDYQMIDPSQVAPYEPPQQ